MSSSPGALGVTFAPASVKGGLNSDRYGNLMPEHRSNHVIIWEKAASDSAIKKRG